MSCLCAIPIVAVLVVLLLKLIDKVRQSFKVPTLPYLEETWWGPRSKSEEDTDIKPFTINVTKEVINDLRQRLDNARAFTPPLEGIQQQYGMNTNLLKEIVDFWKTKYNWEERQAFLNKFPQFTVSIQGLRIHYIYIKPANPEGLKVFPLLLLHGWPGSVREFYEMLPILTSPQPGRNFVFEVIAPSLPGYGFSEAAVRPGLGAIQAAIIFKNLMKKLDFQKYYVQGGDWGSIIGSNMATLYPEQVIGYHSNFCLGNGNMLLTNLKLFLYSFWPTLIVKKEHIDRIYPISERFIDRLVETGYFHLQATKPDTVGVGLNDSPVGLASYIIEKFTTWTNQSWQKLPDGGLTQKFDYTKLLDNVMIYWVTNSITTSMRLYAETMSRAQSALGVAKIPTSVPTVVARFSYDLSYTPTAFLKSKYQNIVHVTDYDAGHFAAFEEPQLLADDIYSGVEKIELFRKSSPNIK